jgi:DNA-binding transcriptional LysR family regulator
MIPSVTGNREKTAVTRHFDPATLRLFVAVCEERNISRAAERESIVASAVSKRIAAIEEQIGAPLLVRGRRGIEPTAAGEVLLRQARDVLNVMERMRAELSEFASGVHGSVRVMASVSVLAERLPDDIASFLARWQSVRVTLDERASPEIVRSVREGSADVGVVWDLTEHEALQAVPYRADRLHVAMHPQHRFAARTALRFEETLDEPAIGVAPGGMMDMLLRRRAASTGRSLAYRIQVSGLETACRIVAAGLGIAVLAVEAVAPAARAPDLRLVPLSDEWARRRFVICSRPDSLLSATTRLLIEHLRTQALPGSDQ